MSVAHEIESKVDILELVGEYVQLKKAGRNWKGLSPFKPERTPSFIVSPDKNIAYCFATHRGGGPIKFLMEVEKLGYGEALQVLAKRAGVELKTNYYKEAGDSAGNMYEIHEIAAEFYHGRLLAPENRAKLDYVLGRGISEESVRAWKIGYADQARELWDKLAAKGYPEKDILDSGIFTAPGRDKFWARVTFPIRNYRGDVVGFSARVTEAGKEPKYLNSPATRIFDKSAVMFGLSMARQEIAKKDEVVVVEGQMDVISLHQAGYRNVVGLSGTALTPQQIRQLQRIARTFTLCLDNDSAGINATFNCVEALANEDVNVKVVRLGEFKDPDEVLKAGADFGKLLAAALTHVGFYIEQGGKRYDVGTVQGKKALANEVLRKLVPVESAVETDLYLGELGQRLGIGNDVLHSELRNLKRNPGPALPPNAPKFQRQGAPAETREEAAPAPDPYRGILRAVVAAGAREEFLKAFPFSPDDLDDPRASALRAYLRDGTADPDETKVLELEAEEAAGGAKPAPEAIRNHAAFLAQRLFRSKASALLAEIGANPEDHSLLVKKMELDALGRKYGLI